MEEQMQDNRLMWPWNMAGWPEEYALNSLNVDCHWLIAVGMRKAGWRVKSLCQGLVAMLPEASDDNTRKKQKKRRDNRGNMLFVLKFKAIGCVLPLAAIAFNRTRPDQDK